jgi:hypothetical protein
VLSCAIAKYSFIVVHPFFNASKYHLKYTRTEMVERIDEIQHPILREALRMIDAAVERLVDLRDPALYAPCSARFYRARAEYSAMRRPNVRAQRQTSAKPARPA